MSHGRQRGGRWGMNLFLHLDLREVFLNRNFQDDRSGDYFRSGYSSSALAADGVRGVGAAVPPPSSLSRSSRGYSDPNEAAAKQISMIPGHGSSSSSRTFANLGRKRIADDEDYFLEEDDSACLEYQPAPGSPAAGKVNQADSEDSDDPLDRYMENIEVSVSFS
ncbi:hypothetical protein AHF37_11197 [Paragonimus kellicotti]|nr:hypothetical protein AHF37_11197 [Paragonimus kellicotti]